MTTWQAPTIAALASPIGTGALALIRMSGAQALDIWGRISTRPHLQPRVASLASVLDAQGRVIDEVIATAYQAPASFTGEQMVEISCHGGMLVVSRILERLLSSGAETASPGEFSRRAFENGKLDLTQAEAVMDIISASSDLALRAAQNQLGGAISQKVLAAIDLLIGLVAHVEAYIDFPEEDISPDSNASMLASLESITLIIQNLLATADEGRLLREGIATAIVGAPNAGKSSLLNCLLGYERAIVSEVEGTTRDTIEERVNIGGLSLRLIDTAGLRESSDAIERAGMQRTRQAAEAAELILHVVDSTQARPELDFRPASSAKTILIRNKCDLAPHADWANETSGLSFCSTTGQGREELEALICEQFLFSREDSDTLAAINLRHRQALERALQFLVAGRESLEANDSPELTALELREALDALGSITGRVDTEDILGSIFSQFCLGK